MSDVLRLGPLAVPWALLVLLGAIALGMGVGHRLGRRTGGDVENLLWQSVLAAAICARLAFVWQFRDAYLASPLDIVDIRDGGWSPLAGLVGAWLYAVSRVARQQAVRRATVAALSTGTAVWLAGTIGLALTQDTERSLPPLSLSALDGSAVPLSAFAGKPTVINVWATWCPPCAREMPVFHDAQAANPGVHFVFVNQGEAVGLVSAWLARRNLPLRNVLIDGKGAAGKALGTSGLPTTLFFDAGGRMVDTRVGELSAATLNERLARLLR